MVTPQNISIDYPKDSSAQEPGRPASAAAQMNPVERQRLAVNALARTQPVSQLAAAHQVSRKFVYSQADKAEVALEECFKATPEAEKVLFYLPVTKTWLMQLVLALVLIGHCSYRGIVEILRDVFDLPMSVGRIHRITRSGLAKAREINQAQDLSSIRVGSHDEIFQGGQPILTGIGLESLYCYLLAPAEHRDATTWGYHLLELAKQGLKPDYTIADAAKGLRAGQQEAWGTIPCHGDVFHIDYQCGQLVQYLHRRAAKATTHRHTLEQQMAKAKQRGIGNTLSKKLALARLAEAQAIQLATDVESLIDWLQHDVLTLAGPRLATRQALYDFIVAQLQQRELGCPHRIAPVRRALENQRDDLLAFAAVLEQKLRQIAQDFDLPFYLVEQLCQLQTHNPETTTYWRQAATLHRQFQGRFFLIQEAVMVALNQTHRASSAVENLNGRLRNYFFLRRQVGPEYLDLLRFFLNHRTFLRSECPERVGKSPTQLMTGQKHPHWLELLGYQRFVRP